MISYDQKRHSYTSSLISKPHGFGTKQLGDGRNTLITIGLKQTLQAQDIIFPKQSHSTNIQVITSTNKNERLFNIDGVITKEKDMLLTVITADCVPIIYYDPSIELIGISHQGWKGTLGQFPLKMLHEMQKLGSDIHDIHCAIGPSINDCCYEVSEKLANQFKEVFGARNMLLREKRWFLNLQKINYQMLISTGIQSNHIDHFPFCTSCNKEEFWSYRRDKGLKGEMVSFVMLK